MKTFFDDNHDWVSSIFDLLRPWQKNDSASNRKAWIRAKGIPLQAWSVGFFHSIVSRFGSLISAAPVTENKAKLDFAYLHVITTVHKPILWNFLVHIDGSIFKVHVEEILQPPLDPHHYHAPISFSPCSSLNHNTQKTSSPLPPQIPPTSNHTQTSNSTAGPLSSRRENSDPFNLMGIIESVNQPPNPSVCMIPHASQNCNDPPSNNISACSSLFSNVAHGPIKVIMSFPRIKAFHPSPPSSHNMLAQPTAPSSTSPTLVSPLSSDNLQSIPTSPTPSPNPRLPSSSSSDSPLSPNIPQNFTKNSPVFPLITKRKKKTKNISNVVLSESSSPHVYCNRRASSISPASPSNKLVPVSFCRAEAEQTVNIGSLLGWDSSRNPDETLSAAVALVQKEGFDWSKSRAEL
ncbi:hypothetical protein Tsubulata_038652 [Turnera subulata]|uniref:DUF4283 domain-containing protein n=1 Tax=Turnera subulata TaxID=218843 RepID=A0A9Q0JAA2_9ROSI|nr:hypothetical protein Tsubulata_038652 [Turnera subulata]